MKQAFTSSIGLQHAVYPSKHNVVPPDLQPQQLGKAQLEHVHAQHSSLWTESVVSVEEHWMRGPTGNYLTKLSGIATTANSFEFISVLTIDGVATAVTATASARTLVGRPCTGKAAVMETSRGEAAVFRLGES